MKKVAASIGVLLAVTSCFAQGTVGMANTAATLVRQWTSVGDSTLISTPAGQGHVEFLWAPDGTTDTSLFQVVGGATPVLVNPTPGRFSSAVAVTVPGGAGGIAPGAIVSGMIRGWTGAFADYASALAAAQGNPAASFLGYSAIFRVDTGDPTAVPAGTPGNIVSSIAGSGFAGVTLQPIPEPATFALAGLSAAAMLIFRRRK